MRAILVIAGKDLFRSVRDRTAIASAVIAPLGLAFILSSVLGGADELSFETSFAVVDRDRGPVARRFTEQVLPGIEREGFASIIPLDSLEAARARAANEDRDDHVAAAYVIPAGFSQAVQEGRPAEIRVLGNPDTPIGAEIARSIAEDFAARLNSVRLAVATSTTLGDAVARDIEAAAQTIAAEDAPVHVEDAPAASSEFDSSKSFFAAGMAVFFLFFTTSFGAVSLLRERREGTLARLVAAPVSRGAIVAAKGLFAYVLGVVSMALLAVATSLMLGARWGDPVGVVLLIVTGVFAAMGIQALVTTLAKTDAQATGYGSVVGVTFGLLGGTFFPIGQGPELLSRLSLVTPHAWLMQGFGELSGGASRAAGVVTEALALTAIGAVAGGIALARSRTLVTYR